MNIETSENIIASNINMSVDFISSLAKMDIQDLDSVRKANKELSSEFDYLVKELGYKDFYELCLGSLSVEQTSKGGNKDFSRLTAVEQTVVRNGKPTKMKIYVDKDKKEEDSEGNDLDKETPSEGKQPVRASDLTRDYSFGDLNSKTTPKKVLDISSELTDWEDSQDFSSESTDYLEGRDENGILRFLTGISKVGKFIQVDFIISDGTVGGYWLTSLYETLKLALDNKLGIKFPDLGVKALYMLSLEYNMQLKGKYLVATFEELKQAVGDF